MIRKLAAAVAGAGLLVTCWQASATTIADTTVGVDPTLTGGFAVEYGTQAVASGFTSDTPATIRYIDAYLHGGEIVQLGLMASDATTGGPSGTWLYAPQNIQLTSTNTVILSSLNWSIEAGQRYWLTAVDNPEIYDGAWMYQWDASYHIPYAVSYTFGNPSDASTWRVNGPPTGQAPAAFISTDDIQATPLPAALSLFATGAGVLGLLGWRKKRKAHSAAKA